MIYRECALKVQEAVDDHAVLVLRDVDVTIRTQQQRVEIYNIPPIIGNLRVGDLIRLALSREES